MAVTAMADDAFWRIIEQSTQVGDDPDEIMTALETNLRERALEEITSFEFAFRGYLNRAYTWDLWGAAYVVHGGCSDDCFAYFRCWLVSRGRAAYEAALADPDSLAQLELQPSGPDGTWEFEEIIHVAAKVFEEKGGDGDLREFAEPEVGSFPTGTEPAGEPFDDADDHLADRYPNLWKRFGNAPLP